MSPLSFAHPRARLRCARWTPPAGPDAPCSQDPWPLGSHSPGLPELRPDPLNTAAGLHRNVHFADSPLKSVCRGRGARWSRGVVGDCVEHAGRARERISAGLTGSTRPLEHRMKLRTVRRHRKQPDFMRVAIAPPQLPDVLMRSSVTPTCTTGNHPVPRLTLGVLEKTAGKGCAPLPRGWCFTASGPALAVL